MKREALLPRGVLRFTVSNQSQVERFCSTRRNGSFDLYTFEIYNLTYPLNVKSFSLKFFSRTTKKAKVDRPLPYKHYAFSVDIALFGGRSSLGLRLFRNLFDRQQFFDRQEQFTFKV